MRKRKWVMRWQTSLMPDPSMIPDATVFLHTSQHFKPTTITTVTKQSGHQYSSAAVLMDSNKQVIAPEDMGMLTPALDDLIVLLDKNLVTKQDAMMTELDPTVMAFLQTQEEENNMTKRDIPIVSE